MSEQKNTLAQSYWQEILRKDPFLEFARNIKAGLLIQSCSQFHHLPYPLTRLEATDHLKKAQKWSGLMYRSAEDRPVGWAILIAGASGDVDSSDIGVFRSDHQIVADTNLSGVMRKLVKHGALLVMDSDANSEIQPITDVDRNITQSLATENVAVNGNLLGVIFPEQFNLPAARSFIYQFLMTAEFETIRLFEETRTDPDRLLEFLDLGRSEDAQWRFERTKDHEPYLRPLHCIHFSDMITIIEKSRYWPDLLGQKIEIDYPYIINLRNRLMHPARLLIPSSDRSHLKRLESNYQALKKYIKSVRILRGVQSEVE